MLFLKTAKNNLSLLIKWFINHKGRGRTYYGREFHRSRVWKRLSNNHPGKEFITVKKGGFIWELPLADDEIASHIYSHGEFNRSEVEDLADYMKKEEILARYLDGSHTLLDVGANYGSVSLLFGQKRCFRKIHAIEPDPSNYSILKKNIAQNSMHDLIIPHNIALSDCNQDLPLVRSSNNWGDHRIQSENKRLHSSASPSVVVQGQTLDCFLERNGLELDRPGLIWMDVQGYEGHVLSSSRILSEHKVPIHLEFWPFGLKESGGFERLIGFLKFNYAQFVELDIRHPKLQPMDRLDGLTKKLGFKGKFTDIFVF
jgi:FkbM family methyltransferase